MPQLGTKNTIETKTQTLGLGPICGCFFHFPRDKSKNNHLSEVLYRSSKSFVSEPWFFPGKVSVPREISGASKRGSKNIALTG